MIPPARIALLALVLLFAASGCATLPAARPLDPGHHEIGLSLGGPVLQLGGSALPIPLMNLQGRHGLPQLAKRNIDLTYGLNLIGLPFGILQGHVGMGWMLIEQRGAAPAFTISDKQFFATNALGLARKPAAKAEGWGANQVGIDFSWEIHRQVIYAGLTQYFDFGNPALTLTPSFGAVFDTSPETDGGLKMHVDFRWFAINQTDRYDAIRWFPRPQGAFGFGVGLSYVFGAGANRKPEVPTTGGMGS